MQVDQSIPGVLILGGSYGSLTAIRSLGRKGIQVAYLGDQWSVAGTSRYITHRDHWRGVAETTPIDKLLDFGRRHGLAHWLILPAADFEVQLVAEHRDALSTFFKVWSMDWAALRTLNDKSQLYPLADQLGLDFPQVYAPSSAPGALTYPVVIKPNSTQQLNALTRAKAWRATDAQDFAAKQADAQSQAGADGFVVQQLIPGDGNTQLSYAGLWIEGREICGMTARRLRQFPLHFGTSPYVESAELPRVAEEARRLLRAVNYSGLVEVEFKHDGRDDRLKLLDVNTRIWAWIGLGEAVGLDFPALAARLAAGQNISEGLTAHHGAAWRRAVPNMLSSLQSLVREGHAGLSPLRSLFGPASPAVFAGDDLWPGLTELPVQALRKLKGLVRR